MKLSLIASAIISLGICLSGAAHAINVGINIGTPVPVIVAPAPVAGWNGASGKIINAIKVTMTGIAAVIVMKGVTIVRRDMKKKASAKAPHYPRNAKSQASLQLKAGQRFCTA